MVAVMALIGVSSMMAGGGRSTATGFAAVNDTVVPTDTTKQALALVAVNDTVVPTDTTEKALRLIAANDTVTPDSTQKLMSAFLA